MEKHLINNENIEIQQLLGNYLHFLSSAPVDAGSHLDEDSLSAFVEGNLSARENKSFMAHFAGCGFCLHRTAELTQLQAHFEDAMPNFAGEAQTQPTKISEVLSGLFSRLFGNFGNEETVFAHEEKKDEEENKDERFEDKDQQN